MEQDLSVCSCHGHEALQSESGPEHFDWPAVSGRRRHTYLASPRFPRFENKHLCSSALPGQRNHGRASQPVRRHRDNLARPELRHCDTPRLPGCQHRGRARLSYLFGFLYRCDLAISAMAQSQQMHRDTAPPPVRKHPGQARLTCLSGFLCCCNPAISAMAQSQQTHRGIVSLPGSKHRGLARLSGQQRRENPDWAKSRQTHPVVPAPPGQKHRGRARLSGQQRRDPAQAAPSAWQCECLLGTKEVRAQDRPLGAEEGLSGQRSPCRNRGRPNAAHKSRTSIEDSQP